MKKESDGMEATRTARCASAAATMGPTAATRVRASAACTFVAGATANSRSTCDALVKAIRGGKVESLIDSGAALVTTDNMAKFQ